MDFLTRITAALIALALLTGAYYLPHARKHHKSTGATDYTSDASMEGYWLQEQASGADSPDGSGNANTLGANSDIGGPTQDSDSQEGSYSTDYESTGYEHHNRTDANLSSGFPGKDTGGHSGSMSFGCWVQLETNTGSMGKSEDGNDVCYELYFNGTNAVFRVSGNGTGWTTATGSTSLTANGTTWYHIVGTFDNSGNDIYLYVNGSQDGTTAFTQDINLGVSEFRLGRAYAGPLDARLDECFVVSRQLSAVEVDEIYDCGLDGSGC